MLEGFTKYILNGIKLPTYSLTCKRAIKLHLDLPKLSSKRPQTILVDLSGILKVLGEGEWKVKVHGKGRPRKWIKLHLAIDAKTPGNRSRTYYRPCYMEIPQLSLVFLHR